jgi:dTDP-4-amino-4,6-dideoxygalactose transaminase
MIPLFKVYMSPEASYEVAKVLNSGYIAEGPKVKDFEAAIQKNLHNPYSALTDTCTSAITMALRMSDVGPGAEVISTPLTCLATNEPILNLGATPVWCDIDEKSLNIDVDKIPELITEKTKAILYVHYSGVPCDLYKLSKIKEKYPHIKLIADCAHAWNAYHWSIQFDSIKIGSLRDVADYSCFSMGPIKHFNSIEGGVLACKTPEDYERAKLLRWYGHDRAGRRTEVRWAAEVYEHGYKFNMNDVNATVGLCNLKDLQTNVRRHVDNAGFYISKIKNPNVKMITDFGGSSPTWWIFNVLLDNEDERQRFVTLLKRHRVDTSVVHTRNDTYKLFEPYKRHLPIMDNIAQRYIAIPVGWHVTDEDRQYIVDIINEEF